MKVWIDWNWMDKRLSVSSDDGDTALYFFHNGEAKIYIHNYNKVQYL